MAVDMWHCAIPDVFHLWAGPWDPASKCKQQSLRPPQPSIPVLIQAGMLVRHVSERTSGLRTTPPCDTWSLPASNWGLISTSSWPAGGGRSTPTTAGTTLSTLMKARSSVARSTCGARKDHACVPHATWSQGSAVIERCSFARSTCD